MKLTSSIAMCTYNGERYLKKQLESFVCQTVLPQELVVCDDVSTDGTLEILHEFAASAPFCVRIYENEKNLGYVRNFEKAAAFCTQDIVFFSDQDDIWLPEKNERALHIFEEHPEAGLLLLSAVFIDADDNQLPFPVRIQRKMAKNPPNPELEVYHVQSVLHRWIASWQGCNMAYRNSLKELIYPVSSELGHDQWLLLLLGVFSETLILHTPTLLHRIHNQNTSRLSCAFKNPLMRLFYSIQRHQSPQRYRQKAALFEGLLNRIQEHPACVQHSGLIPVFQRFYSHLLHRAEAIESMRLRPKIVFHEWYNGNYDACSKGIKDVLSDILALPAIKKRPENLRGGR